MLKNFIKRLRGFPFARRLEAGGEVGNEDMEGVYNPRRESGGS